MQKWGRIISSQIVLKPLARNHPVSFNHQSTSDWHFMKAHYSTYKYVYAQQAEGIQVRSDLNSTLD